MASNFMNITTQTTRNRVLLDICKHDNPTVHISRLAKMIRLYPDSIFKSDEVWKPIAQKVLKTIPASNFYNAVAIFYSTPLKHVNVKNNTFFITHTKRIYLVEYPQLCAVRIDSLILDTKRYSQREVIDIASSKNIIAFATKNPNGIIINDIGLLTRDQIDRQVFMNNILWTELVMFKNVKVKKILAYWTNLMILLENGTLLSLFANRQAITDPWKMNTIMLKLPESLGTHNVIQDIFETGRVYNLIRNRCVDVEDDVEEVYPPIFRCTITDGEIFVNVQPHDRNPTIPNTILHVLDNIENER